MIALVFDTPERLWWSFVLLIPLGLHLWRRRHFQPKSWAAMQFVLQAWQEESQKAKLQNLLLVLLRVAVLALFLFAISAPSTGVRRPIVGDESTGTHHIVIIDSTYSMATIDQKSGKSALAEAKQKAIDYVRELPNGDVVSVLTIGEFEQWIVEIPGNDFQQVAAAINEITVQSAGGNLQDVLELSAELIKRYREQDPNLLNAHLVVFTDMERNVWETISDQRIPQCHLGQLCQIWEHSMLLTAEWNLWQTQLLPGWPFSMIRVPLLLTLQWLLSLPAITIKPVTRSVSPGSWMMSSFLEPKQKSELERQLRWSFL